MPVCGRFMGMDNLSLRTDCGHFMSAANSRLRPVKAVESSRMWTACCRIRGCGQNSDVDCSRTRMIRVHVLHWDCLCSWNCRVCGHEPPILRVRSAPTARPIRGRKNVPNGRGNACLVLNMMRNTLPPLLHQFFAPLFQLRGNGLNSAGLFDGGDFDAPGLVIVKRCLPELHGGIGSALIKPLAQFIQHLNGGA